MNKLFQRLFLFRKLEIKTKLSRVEVQNRIDSFCRKESFSDYEDADYYGSVWYDGFWIAEKSRKFNGAGYTQNSFAPVLKAKIEEDGEQTVISGTLRMNQVVLVMFVPVYLLLTITLILFPIIHIILHFAFFKRAKKLEEKIEMLLLER